MRAWWSQPIISRPPPPILQPYRSASGHAGAAPLHAGTVQSQHRQHSARLRAPVHAAVYASAACLHSASSLLVKRLSVSSATCMRRTSSSPSPSIISPASSSTEFSVRAISATVAGRRRSLRRAAAPPSGPRGSRQSRSLVRVADEMRDWPRATSIDSLTEETREFRAALPATRELDTVAGKLLLAHGLGRDDMTRVTDRRSLEFHDLRDFGIRRRDAAVDFCGHTHQRCGRSESAASPWSTPVLKADDTPCFGARSGRLRPVVRSRRRPGAGGRARG